MRCLAGLVACASLFVLLLPGERANAERMRTHDATSMRSFHGGPVRIRRSFRSDHEARRIFSALLAAGGFKGLEDRIELRASPDTPAAEAFIENGQRLIIYNAVFMQDIRRRTNNYWSLIAILAHEVGHHVRFHTAIPGRDHEFELEADYQAGFFLRRMGATLAQTQQVFRTFPEAATKTHPGRADRVQNVTLGWIDGGDRSSAASTTDTQANNAQIASRDPGDGPATTAPTCDGISVGLGSGGTACIKPGSGASFRDCSNCPEMVVVPNVVVGNGRYLMGSPRGEPGRDADERQTEVAIRLPFAIGRFEITFAEWDACVRDGGCNGRQPPDSGWGRSRRPVINVSWQEAQSFVGWLSRKTGKRYRLPGEGEWEWAARAGTRTSYFFGDNPNALCAFANGSDLTARRVLRYSEYVQCDDGNAHTATVGSFQPNAWGLHDVHGNVWEWTADCYGNGGRRAPSAFGLQIFRDRSDGCARRVYRGGAWHSRWQDLRSADRNGTSPLNAENFIGFRVVRDLD